MPTSYRAMAAAGMSAGEADSLDGLVEIMKGAPRGHYRIERISLDATTGELRSWRQGLIIKDRKGGIKLHPPPWLD